MNLNEAKEWLTGTMSMTNLVPHDPIGTWEGRIAHADAEMVKQAYWIVRAHQEGLINSQSLTAEPDWQALAAKMADHTQEAMKLMRDSGADEREYVVFAVLHASMDAYAEAQVAFPTAHRLNERLDHLGEKDE